MHCCCNWILAPVQLLLPEPLLDAAADFWVFFYAVSVDRVTFAIQGQHSKNVLNLYRMTECVDVFVEFQEHSIDNEDN